MNNACLVETDLDVLAWDALDVPVEVCHINERLADLDVLLCRLRVSGEIVLGISQQSKTSTYHRSKDVLLVIAAGDPAVLLVTQHRAWLCSARLFERVSTSKALLEMDRVHVDKWQAVLDDLPVPVASALHGQRHCLNSLSNRSASLTVMPQEIRQMEGSTSLRPWAHCFAFLA